MKKLTILSIFKRRVKYDETIAEVLTKELKGSNLEKYMGNVIIGIKAYTLQDIINYELFIDLDKLPITEKYDFKVQLNSLRVQLLSTHEYYYNLHLFSICKATLIFKKVDKDLNYFSYDK